MAEAEEVVRKPLSLQFREGKLVQARISIPVHWIEELGIKEPVKVKLRFYPKERKIVLEFPPES